MAIVEESLVLKGTPTIDSSPSPIRFTLRVESVAAEIDNSPGPSTPGPSTPPTPQITGWLPHWGTWPQWISAIAALVVCAFVVITFVDNHIDKLFTPVDKKFEAIDKRFDAVDKKFDTVNQQLTDLTGKIGDVNGQVKTLLSGHVKLTREQKELSDRVGQQEALNRIQDPDRILGIIRTDIKLAQDRQGRLSASQLADYKAAIHTLPTSAREYWTTVAEIINYQSLVNQMSGEAPDPSKVARSCGVPITSPGGGNVVEGNLIIGGTLPNCVVDLDRQNFQNVTFQNSVIRYHGGPVFLKDVSFVNCRFVLDLPAGEPVSPAQQKLLLTILNSADQKTIRISG